MKQIPLIGKLGMGKFALVDDGDFEYLNQWCWTWITGYARRSRLGGVSQIYMHVLLMGGTGWDHEDGDGLNNQRFNLRPASHSENMANRRKFTGTSLFKGVSWDSEKGLWLAQVYFEKKRVYRQCFVLELEAAKTYDFVARQIQGPFSKTNF